MPRVILQPDQFRDFIRERRESGADHLDEVWNGVYVVSPEADNQHQLLSGRFVGVFHQALDSTDGLLIFPTINVSDREVGWRKNFRIPDASVFLPGNRAVDRKSHWLGGPDFAVEILSRGDRSRKKFDFYAKVNVRELLLLDRKPWKLELHRREGDAWHLVGASTPDDPAVLASAVLPLAFRLLPAEARPRLEVTRPADGRSWTI